MMVLKQGAEIARMGDLMGFTTLLFLVVMVAWTVWAWAPGHKKAMDAAANLPLED